MNKFFTLLLAILLFGVSHYSQAQKSSAPVRAVAELGFLGVLGNKIQFSQNGTYFDYRKDGGQDVLFPFSRLSVEVDFKKRNALVFLYQPLRIESQVLLQNDLLVDNQLFPANTSVKLLYNFPFFRASYLRELMPNNSKYNFGIGGTLQLRNATISFESGDGTLYRTNRDVGPVPALKMRGTAFHKPGMYSQIEIDGMYAPVSYLNGSDNEIIGAILDASYRFGLDVHPNVKSFLNLRYLGGGAVGTSDDKGPGDGYVKNWLHFTTLTLGFEYNFGA